MILNPSHGGPPPRKGFLKAPGWSAAVRRSLEEMVVTHAGGLAAFDFDDTLVDGDISIALLRRMQARIGRDLEAEYESECQALGKRVAYAKLVETLIAGRSEPEVRADTEAAILAGLADGSLRFRPALAELIWAMQRHGWRVWVVTASPAVVIAPAAQRVGVGADRVLGMWCDTDEDGRFCAPTREPVTYRGGKVVAFSSANEGANPLFAAGDAITDLEMLCVARYALVIDRGNQELLAQAKQRAWWVQGGI